jgi:O-antigen ligase/tetratricopeptide (TPR) repeat protein
MLDHRLQVLVASVILIAPLPFGLVEPQRRPWLGFAACLVVLAWSLRPELPPLDRTTRAAVAAALALVLVALLQIVPLPPFLLSILAPGKADLVARLQSDSAGLGRFAALHGQGGLWTGALSWNPLSAYPEATRRAILTLISVIVLGCATAIVCRDRKAARRLAVCFVAIGVFEAVYGLSEYLTGHQHIFGYHKRHYVHSVTGTYINKNHFAGLMEMALLLALGLYWDQIGARRRRPGLKAWMVSLSDDDRGRSTLTLLSIGLMGSALLLSFSRTGIVVGALAAAGLLIWLGAGRARAVPRAAGAVCVIVCVLSPLAWFGRREIIRSFAQVPTDVEAPGGRFDAWKATAAMIGDAPLAGWGLGTFENVFPRYEAPTIRVTFDHAHNDYLELAAGLGVPALLIALVATAFLIARAARASRLWESGRGLLAGATAACIALLLHEIVDFNLAIPANALLFGICLGLAAGMVRPAPGAAGPWRLSPGWARALGVTLGCVLSFEASTEFLAATRVSRAQGALDTGGDPADISSAGESVRLARQAVRIRPADAEAHATMATSLSTLLLAKSVPGPDGAAPAEVASLAREMAGSILAAIRANPWDAVNYSRLLLALHLESVLRPEASELSSEASVGPIAAGMARTIVFLAPTSTLAHRAMGGYLLGTGDREGAAAEYRRALLLDPVLVPEVARHILDSVPDRLWVDQVIPDTAPAQLRYGVFLEDMGEIARAEIAYGASLKAGPSAAAALRLHGLYLSTCRAGEAQQVAARALASTEIPDPAERAELQYALSRSSLRTGDGGRAVEALQAAVHSAPRRVLYAHSLASLLARDRPAEAIPRWVGILDAYRGAADMPEMRAEIYLGLARAYEKEGRTLEALREYKHVLVDRPDDPSVLGRITLLMRGDQ